jgi:hypothetical protein
MIRYNPTRQMRIEEFKNPLSVDFKRSGSAIVCNFAPAKRSMQR